MSGDSFKPEEGGEIEVINPDEGNNEIETQPDSGDAMDAAELDALKALEDTSEDNEAMDEEVESEPVTEDEQADEDQAEPEAPDEDEGEEVQAEQWDGNPATLPEALKPAYQSMIKGYHSKMRELAEERRKTVELNAQLMLKQEGGPDSAPKDEGPPSLPTGENVTAEQWEQALDKRQEYFANKLLQEKIASGEIITPAQVQPLQQEAQVSQRLMQIQSLEGYTPEVEDLMVQIADADTTGHWKQQISTNSDGMIPLALMAIEKASTQKANTAQATKKAQKIKKQATAASRATPRTSSPAGASPEDVFARDGFKNENERMEYAEKAALEQYGS